MWFWLLAISQFATVGLVPWVMLVYITFKLWSRFTPLGRFGILMWHFFRVLGGFWGDITGSKAVYVLDILCPCVYAGAKSHLTRLDYLFVGMQLVSRFGCIIVDVLYNKLVAPSVYDEWISSYGPEPPDEGQLKWTMRVHKVYGMMDRFTTWSGRCLGYKPRTSDEAEREPSDEP
ncbi:hypothetical protein B0A52_00150 [Exophiala mesophila]|uniref:Uncharacterized protein n=1 Tax=Exophiala mesophila TaxID=212818 RepID=A0A438NJ84_EXOME|nr:hypothetical protein B0A52_00150 [Exophiala mesophila]